MSYIFFDIKFLNSLLIRCVNVPWFYPLPVNLPSDIFGPIFSLVLRWFCALGLRWYILTRGFLCWISVQTKFVERHSRKHTERDAAAEEPTSGKQTKYISHSYMIVHVHTYPYTLTNMHLRLKNKIYESVNVNTLYEYVYLNSCRYVFRTQSKSWGTWSVRLGKRQAMATHTQPTSFY